MKHQRIPSRAAQKTNANLALASRTLRLLSDEEVQQWRDYAATLVYANVKTGVARPRQWDKVFVGLACRFQQVNTFAEPPRTPPPFPFGGDPVTLTAQAVTGGVRFTASGPTSPSVRVELLLQRLPSPVRSPQPGRFRCQAFHSFTEAGDAVTVETLPGWFIPAYRFVNADTGQDTPLLSLPKATVTQ